MNPSFFNLRLFRKGRDLQLQYLDVSGCKNITDKTLFQLSSSLGKLPASDGISDIEDNSCDCHTSCSCVHKSSVVPESSRRGLVHLGLSGCYQVTDAGLRYTCSRKNAIMLTRMLQLDPSVLVIDSPLGHLQWPIGELGRYCWYH